MAKKRMFDLDTIDTDFFLEMSQGARLLYYDFGMRADDDGFVSNPKKIMKMTNASEDDLKILFSKQYIIPFDSGICVIRHWKMNNYLRGDRYKETIYTNEKNQLVEDENGVYLKKDNLVYQMSTNGIHSIEENRIVKNSIDKNNIPQIDDVKNYCLERKNDVDYNKWYDFYQSKGWMIGKNKMKDWKACVRTWEKKDDKLPDWFDKKLEQKVATKEEQEEADKLLEKYK